MALNFNLRDVLSCAATDDEGFRCVRPPNHSGPHEWGRCPYADEAGHRCFLPPGHPGNHAMPWFDSPAHEGDHHLVRYEGTEADCQRHAVADMRVFLGHGWRALDSTFTAWRPWRSGPTARPLSALLAPRGRLEVEYEFHLVTEGAEPQAE
jgi:hypothetical protein